LEDNIVFPNMSVTLTVDVGDEERVFLVPVHEGEYAGVGTVAEVTASMRLPGGGIAVTVSGLHRGIAGAAHTGADGRLRVEVDERPDVQPPRVQTAELEREYRAVVEEILDLRDADARVHDFVRSITEAGALADTSAYAPDINFAEKVELLETIDIVERLVVSLRAAHMAQLAACVEDFGQCRADELSGNGEAVGQRGALVRCGHARSFRAGAWSWGISPGAG